MFVRDRMIDNHLVEKPHKKEVAYLSAEFLIGPQLSNNLLNLDIRKELAQQLVSLDMIWMRF